MKSEGAEIRPGIRSLEQPSTPKMELVEGFLHRGETRSDLCFEEITLAVLVLSRSRWEFLLEVIIALVGCDVDGIGRVTGRGEKSVNSRAIQWRCRGTRTRCLHKGVKEKEGDQRHPISDRKVTGCLLHGRF